MAFDPVLTGATANDGTGDPLRTAFTRINDNFDLAVEGAASSTDGTVVQFDGTTGKVVKASSVAVADIIVEGDARLTDSRTPTAHGNEAHTSTFVDAAGAAAAAPVQSVNTLTGAVVLDAAAVGAYPDTNPSSFVDAAGAAAAAPVQSVNTLTGAVVLDSDDVAEGTTNLYNRVPTGGTTGQVLAKASGTNYDTAWRQPFIDSPNATGTNRFIPIRGFVIFGNSNVPSAGQIDAVPIWVPVNATLNRIDISVTTAGSAGAIARLGIYSNGSDFKPDQLLVQGTVNAETTGIKSLTISLAVTQGYYWLATASQGSPGTVPGFRAINPRQDFGYYFDADLNSDFTGTARVLSFGDAVFPATYPAYNRGFLMINTAVRYTA
jgi:hypothetical protein